MDIWQSGTKKRPPKWKFLILPGGKTFFGFQSIQMNKMTCFNEKPTTFCEADKKYPYNHESRVLSALEAI